MKKETLSDKAEVHKKFFWEEDFKQFIKETLDEIDKLHNKLEKEYSLTTGALKFYKLTYDDLMELKQIIKQKAGKELVTDAKS